MVIVSGLDTSTVSTYLSVIRGGYEGSAFCEPFVFNPKRGLAM
jgi:hypothetical protein